MRGKKQIEQIVEALCLLCVITRDRRSNLDLGSVSWDRDKYQAYTDLKQMTSLIWSYDVTAVQKRVHFELKMYYSYQKD